MGFFSWFRKLTQEFCKTDQDNYSYCKSGRQLRNKKKVAKHFAKECLVFSPEESITRKELAEVWHEWVTRPANARKYTTFDPTKTRGLVQGLMANNPGIISNFYSSDGKIILYYGIGKKNTA